MAFQMGGPHKSFATLLAEVSALTAVSPLVPHQGLPATVNLPAILTAQVGLLVFLQLRNLSIAPPTGWAVVRPFAHVVASVLGQVCTLAVGLPTFRALERSLSSVDSPMSLQVRCPDEAFPTVGTLVGLLGSVALLVVLQGCAQGKPLPTFLALEGLLN